MFKVAAILRNIFFITIATASQAFAASPVYYQESNGIVVFESESTALADDWVLSSEIPGATGDAYIRWEGANFYREATAGEGVLTYHFTVETPGNYQLLWRSRIAEGTDDREHNDSWVRMATGSNVEDEHPLDNWTKAYMNDLDEWSWSTKTVDGVGNPLRQFFDAGDHTLEISGRSFGHAIDRVVLYQYETIGFSENAFNTIPESQTTTESSSPSDPNDENTGDTDSTDSSNGSDSDNGDPQTDADENNGNEIAAINATELPQSSESTEISPGECSSNRLELSAILDLHEREGRLIDTNPLEMIGNQGSIYLKFDLSKVPPASEAALLYTVAGSTSRSEIRIDLGSNSDWKVNDPSSNAPSYLVDLAQATADWAADVRYKSMLDATLLQSAPLSIILTMTEGGDEFSLIASDDTSHGPRLLLTGNSNFCEDYRLLNQDTTPAIVEEEITTELPEPIDIPRTVVDSTVQPSDVSKSGGVSLWMLLTLLSLCAFPRVSREHLGN